MSIEPKSEGCAQGSDVQEVEYYVEVTDDFYCEYDSTWETKKSSGSKKNGSKKNSCHRSYTFESFRRAARDMQNYRHDYPNQNSKYSARRHQQDEPMPNLSFYVGRRTSCPDEIYIDEFHDWFGDYTRLERVHTFIQWLFPLQEPGMNYQAIKLTKEEILAFRQNQTAKDNLLKSYKLMLDFYGIELSNELTGEVKRAHNWQERFQNLDRNTHNNLRITRILKCLGDLGYEHYQAPLVHFFLEETLVHSQLPNVKESVLHYFMFTVRNKQQRRELIKYAYDHFDEDFDEEFVWCPKRIQNIWSKGKSGRRQARTVIQDCDTGHEGKTQVDTEDKNKQREVGDRMKDDDSPIPELDNDDRSQAKDNMADLKEGDVLPEEKDESMNTGGSSEGLEDSVSNSSPGQVPLMQACAEEDSSTNPTEPCETDGTARGTDEGPSTQKSTSENRSTLTPTDQQVSSETSDFSQGQVTETSDNQPTEQDQRSDRSREESINGTASGSDEKPTLNLTLTLRKGTSENRSTLMPNAQQQMPSKTSDFSKGLVTETSDNKPMEQDRTSDSSREEPDNGLEDSVNNSSTRQVPLIQMCAEENSNTTPTDLRETETTAGVTDEGLSTKKNAGDNESRPILMPDGSVSYQQVPCETSQISWRD